MPTRRYVRSKLLPPRLHPVSVERPRLVERLLQSTDPVWLLSAPAGYGKTTVLLQALEHLDAATSWMSIDSADNDPVRFWLHVAAAIFGDGDELERAASGVHADHLQDLIDQVLVHVEAQVGRVALVLDDLHEIHNPIILEALGRVVHHPPINLTLVLATRSDPPLPLGRLRSRGELLELRGADLAFKAEEAGELLGGTVDPDGLAGLIEGTEGWPTALRMLAVSSGSGRTPIQLLEAAKNPGQDLADFLAVEVLNAQDPATRQFLIETSVLRDLNPSLCDAVVGATGSLSRLRGLANGHVFTTLVDPASDTFRYHRLFRDFLRVQARELGPDRLKHLHRSAAIWHQRRASPTNAITHAVAAEEFALAHETILENYIEHAQVGLLDTVDGWLKSYGRDRCMADPVLRAGAAWIALNARRFDDVDAWLEPLPTAVGHDDPAWLGQQRFFLEVNVIHSHRSRHFGNLPLALAQAEAGARHITDPTDVIGVGANAALGLARMLSGDTDTALHEEVVAHSSTIAADSSTVSGYYCLAFIVSLDEDSMAEADALADQALAFVDTPLLERFHQPALAYLVKSKVALSQGRAADACDFVQRGEAIARYGIEPLILVLIHCQRALVAHALGDAATTRAQLRYAKGALGTDGGSFLAETVRLTGNATRFATLDDKLLPPGALSLTERELVVLRLLPHALPRRKLAAQLHVSENTIKSQLTSIRHKLGAESREEILSTARDLGLLEGS